MRTSILIIDDDKQYINEIEFILEKDFECISASNSASGIEIIMKKHPDIILLDLMLGKENGISILKEIKKIDEGLPVIMITEYASIDTAVQAMRIGAEDYISKTPNLEELKLIIERSLKRKIDKLKTETLKEEINKSVNKIIGSGKVVREIKSQINMISKSSNTVLITGESGTGKELVARSIHEKSDRKNEIFIAVNCAALPENLIESELFGHEQGAFTGAIKKKAGKFEIASGGTIFLDEIGELKPEAQVKLMRVLQEKEFERVGGNKVIYTGARIIAATNKPLLEMVETGKFRRDLFYRLDVFPIHIEPLRNRKEDIPELIQYFLESISRELKVKTSAISEDCIAHFINYDWPGNIRELINYLTRAIILSGGKIITKEILSRQLLEYESHSNEVFNVPLKWFEMDKVRKKAAAKASRQIETIFAKKLLSQFKGNITKAAEFAGIDRTNLHRIIKRCGI